jgi:hypothetical protein
VLVAQDQARIEIYERQGHRWTYASIDDREQNVTLEAIQCELSLSDVYARVPIPPAQAEAEASATEPTSEEEKQ